MPGITPRVGIGLVAAVGVLTLAAVGVGWRGWLAAPEAPSAGLAAYADGDWDRAAELARRRLKAAPADPGALRLLARSTARQGRDAQANAMFARLGSDGLEAEDLFLLARGLDRAGRTEEAFRLWEKALRLDPDHADVMEALVARYAARNRIAEAAKLAGRLAKRPGRELRGELDQGALLAELDDPAGSADLIRRALDRPEALGMERSMQTRYRDLLARSLLRTGRAGEARAVLRGVLDGGPDVQASWLLSRAALLEGDIPAAAAALEAAGSYHAEHPLEAEPSPFVGEARCAECHADVARATRASRHATTLVRGKDLLTLPYPPHPVTDPDDHSVRHAFVREDGHIRVETIGRDQVVGAVVDYAFGAPDRYFSLVGRDAGGLSYVLRLSHSGVGWVRTTGHSADADSGAHLLGKPLDPSEGAQKCLFCHCTNPRAVMDGTGPESKDAAIGCERCHGPGAVHVKAVDARFTDLAIVRPGEATAEGRLRLCGQCHSYHDELPLPRTDPFWIRFQGTTLPWSRCYTESDGAFDCLTCHDPHHDADRSEDRYNRRCVECHAAAPKAATAGTPDRKDRPARGAVCPVNPTDGCVGCHMPPVRSNVIHATFTDHYIRVHPKTPADLPTPPASGGAVGHRPEGGKQGSPGR